MSWKKVVPDPDLYTYDYFFLDHVCRLCWCADGSLELSSYNPKCTENDTTIAEKIQECIGIDVSTHSHPNKVCTKCLDEVEIFTEFRRFCQETDRKLQNILENGTSTQNVPPTEEDELLILKQEPDMEFLNLEIGDSIDDIFNLPPCQIKPNKDRPLKKERRKRPTYYCNFCHLNLEAEEKLTEHNFECHGIEKDGLYKCFGCEKRFKSVKKRLRHETETCKSLKSGYKCSICNRCLPKRRVYEHHMRAHRENKEINIAEEIKCNKCKETFESIECLRQHALTHFSKEKKSYVCDACGRVFSRRDYLTKHKLTHAGGRHLKCPHCDYSALQKSTLNVHMRRHTGERPYPCDLCPQRCVTSSNLRDHRKRHFGVKAFECKLCDKKFGYKLSLEEHMGTTHERSETHVCVHCGVTYNRFRSLRHHLFAKHGKKVKKTKQEFVELQNGQIIVENIQVQQKTQLTDGNCELTVRNTQLSDGNCELTVRNSQLTDGNCGLAVRNNQVTDGNNELTVRNSQLTDGNCGLAVRNNQVTDGNNELTVRNNQLIDGNSELTVRSSQMTVINSQLTDGNSELAVRNSQMTDGNSELTASNSQLTDGNGELAVRNSQLTDRNCGLAVRNSQLTFKNSQTEIMIIDTNVQASDQNIQDIII